MLLKTGLLALIILRGSDDTEAELHRRLCGNYSPPPPPGTQWEIDKEQVNLPSALHDVKTLADSSKCSKAMVLHVLFSFLLTISLKIIIILSYLPRNVYRPLL
jgi:hypothetical protein